MMMLGGGSTGRALREGIKLFTFVWNVPTNGIPLPKCPSRAQKKPFGIHPKSHAI